MAIADQKILTWLMKGPVEYNKVTRDIDFKILHEALDSDYRSTFEIIENYYSRYKTPPSYKILEENLADDPDTVQLASILKRSSCEESEILFYVDQVRKRYNSEIAQQLAYSISSGDVDVEEFNSNVIGVAAKIERLKRTAVFAEGPISNSVDDRFNDYLFTEQNPNIATGVMSGFKEIDDYTYGIKPSELMIISGASSSGKSLLMMNYAINAWLGNSRPQDGAAGINEGGKNVLYFTLEMSKRQLEQRIDANVADIRHRAIMRGQLTPEEKVRWKDSLEFQKYYEKKFYIVDMPRGSRTIDIEARYDAILSEFQPDLVVVDYLGIMKPNKDSGQDWLEVGHVAEDLHEFCRNKNVAVLTAAQRKARNKAAKGQSNDLEELGRSKMIGDNANIVLLIEQRDDEHLLDDMVIHIVKNRDGAKGEVKLYKEFEKSKVISIPDNWTGGLGEENSFA
jgi:replicative DNA helicase